MRPTTMPGGDVLQPRSEAPLANQPVYLLQEMTPAATTGPATGGEGRYIIVDGKSVLVGNQGATTPGMTVAPAPAGSPAGADPKPVGDQIT